MGFVKTAYLVLFNIASSVGWAYVLGQTFQLVYTDQDIALSSAKLWGIIETPLKVVQTMAVFEVLHALLGLVRSPVGSTFLQVSSRLFLVWAINVLCPDSRYHWGFILMVASWSLVEVPRYAFYALNLLDAVPDWLFFLRYHLFMVLYPSGVTGEVSCMLKALPFLSSGAYSIQMPNTHNISLSLYVVVLLTLVVYAPGLPFMYTHMNVQRKKAYAKKNEATKTLKKE
ncbi:hypothetical protein DYB25_006173 [Aphanomyces astaci]|uniref:very-long-chain (3R)-3-hydroxyacyl-CoA dehydratase n=1 Tax=Aphanomyces astaci TaxID=112090 RepID=A0A397DLL1_APHAT|nr:hypothetical protein DYB36_008950 [Aphanomyces astaci]RHY13931.1 hypothetical protein DYB25_006173 [Aphanomyces astaci]RHY60552.1 hypothetical protein DYB30_004052 [Aphanomyces astaci]RHY67456.1 hypothetical protein DYB38_004326 [Aphanomyces astaci]RHY72296.1 hypothetical protein DYB34_004970 [Aphanomyces astaci]